MKLFNKVTQFISGHPYDKPLENRVFNSTTFGIVIISILATIVNIILHIGASLSYFTLAISIIFGVIYILARFYDHYSILNAPFVILIYGIATFIWFFNGGTLGPTPFAFFFLMISFIIISRKKQYYFYVFLTLAVLTGLMIIELTYPNLIKTYENESMRFWDVGITMLIFILLAGLNTGALRLNYNYERKRAILKNQEIKSSLIYASRIQDALLQSTESITKEFKDGFVWYLPKDIVSGDFYWYRKVNGKEIIAAVDCTGHGVPGALLSTLGIAYLNEILNNIEDELNPAIILEELRRKVRYTLHHNNPNDVADGMAISMCMLDSDRKNLTFAGAGLPMYLIRDNGIIRIKGKQLPIGIFLSDKNFENHHFELEEGDKIYMFTDGYYDQFGGSEGKKYNYKRFREYLLNIQNDPFSKQKRSLIENFIQWKGKTYDQVDDILIIGLQL